MPIIANNVVDRALARFFSRGWMLWNKITGASNFRMARWLNFWARAGICGQALWLSALTHSLLGRFGYGIVVAIFIGGGFIDHASINRMEDRVKDIQKNGAVYLSDVKIFQHCCTWRQLELLIGVINLAFLGYMMGFVLLALSGYASTYFMNGGKRLRDRVRERLENVRWRPVLQPALIGT